MIVQITPGVRQYLKKLSRLLYEKNYFSYLDGAERYIEDLLSDIHTRLPIKPHRAAPRRFDSHGKDLFLATFRKSRRTAWYVFFTRHESVDGETVFIVRHIDNNHKIAKHI